MSKVWTPVRFYKESRRYMQGYSNWHFFKRLPRAFIIFYGMEAQYQFYRLINYVKKGM